jgi:hypothetical protein
MHTYGWRGGQAFYDGLRTQPFIHMPLKQQQAEIDHLTIWSDSL